jgi:hypothetical protein
MTLAIFDVSVLGPAGLLIVGVFVVLYLLDRNGKL